MKRGIVIIIILLVAGVLFEKRHRAAMIKNLPLTYQQADAENTQLFSLADTNLMNTNFSSGNFLSDVDLWGNPFQKTVEPQYGRFYFSHNSNPANFETLQSKLNVKSEPVLTVANRELDYALFSVGGFSLTLNLKPAYANPQSLFPTRLDAGIGGSFSF